METATTAYDGKVPPYDVITAMLACGLDATKAKLIATELFDDMFEACIDKTIDELKDNFKSLAAIPKADGGVKIAPGQKTKVTSFTLWVKHQYRMGRDPTTLKYPYDKAIMIKQKAATHKLYMIRYEAISAAAKPERLTKDTKWEEWAPSFLNYLRTIPGRDGVPLLYITREQEAPDPTPKTDYLDEYINNAPLTGNAFVSDAAQVHVYLINMIAQNDEAESVIKTFEKERNGRKDWLALKVHYEGQGLYSNDIMTAEKDINTMYYLGEKKPTMWWLEFERRLNNAFNVYVRIEKREVHSDNMKLRILLDKVRCEWLNSIKTSISIELTKIPVTYTYSQALMAFRNEVNRRFPPGSSPSKVKRTIQQLEGGGGRSQQGRGYFANKGRGRGGRGRGRGRGGRGRGRGRGGRGYGYRRRDDSQMITLRDGQQIEYHPSFNFPDHIYEQFTDEHKDMLRRQRREHNESRQSQDHNSKRTIAQMQTEIDELKSIASQASVPPYVQGSNQSAAVSEVTKQTSIMGGRNEQSNKRQYNGGRKG
jgi:hypothetical protein